jgi:hypothetical protein
VYTNAMRLSSWTSPRRDCREQYVDYEKCKLILLVRSFKQIAKPCCKTCPFSFYGSSMMFLGYNCFRRILSLIHPSWPYFKKKNSPHIRPKCRFQAYSSVWLIENSDVCFSLLLNRFISSVIAVCCIITIVKIKKILARSLWIRDFTFNAYS